MKKNGLFKVLLCTLAVILVCTYVFSVSGDIFTGTKNYLAITDGIILSLASFSFQYLLVYILLIGGLYGVLGRIPAYRKFLDLVVSKVKKNGNVFLIWVMAIFALVTALTGITMPLLIFVPMVISIILLLGYDKLVAIASTIGAILIGAMGAITSVYAQSGGSESTVWELLGIKFSENIFPKIFILLAAIGLLIFNVLSHIKAVKEKAVNYEIENTEDLLLGDAKTDKKTRVWPLYVILGIFLVVLILGFVPWNTLFGFEGFDQFYDKLGTLGFGKGEKAFIPFTAIVTTFIPPFGRWLSVSFGYLYLVNMMIVFTLVTLKFVFRVKFDDLMDNFMRGAKRILPAAMLAIFAYAVFMLLVNTGNFYTNLVTTVLDKLKGFNLAVSSIFTLLGSALHIDFVNALGSVYQPIIDSVKALSDSATVLPVLEIMFQSLHYLAQLVAPTSILLIIGLTYLQVPYKAWLKFIWKLFLELFILIFIVLMILLLI